MTKEATNAIIALLDSSDDWNTSGKYRVHHYATGIELWVGNGMLSVALYENRFMSPPPFFMKRKLWKAIDCMRSRMIQKQIYDSMERNVLNQFDKKLISNI